MSTKSERGLAFAEITNTQNWIVDGVSKTLLEAADTIIFLDYPRTICYWRVFCRNIKYLFRSRPELPKNYLNQFGILKNWKKMTYLKNLRVSLFKFYHKF